MTQSRSPSDDSKRTPRPRRTISQVFAPLRMKGDKGDGAEDAAKNLAAMYWRDVDCLWNAHTQDLGPFLRWLAIFKLAHECSDTRGRSARTPIDVARGVFSRLPESRRPPDEAISDKIRRALYTGVGPDHAWRAPRYLGGHDKSLSDAFELFVNEVREASGAQHTSMREILAVRVMYRNERLTEAVIERFMAWLARGTMPARENVTRLQCQPYALEIKARTRKPHLTSIEGLLLPPSGQERAVTLEALQDIRPVLNIWSPANWSGLRAFATELILRIKTAQALIPMHERYVVLYLPLNRFSSRAGEKWPSRRQVLETLDGWLAPPGSFLEQDGSDGGESPGVDRKSPDDVRRPYRPDHELISRIRKRLTETKTLLVIDGIEQASPPFADLFDLLRGTDWQALLRALIQPDSMIYANAHGVRRSRFVLLSDRPLTKLQPWLATAGASSRLPNVSAQLATTLLAADEHDLLYRELARRIGETWPSLEGRPTLEPKHESIRSRYPLATASLKALSKHADGFPSELELAMACCAERLGLGWRAANTAESDFKHRGPDFLLHVMYLYLHHDHRSDAPRAMPPEGAVVALQLLAISLRGMDTDAMARALTRFAATEPNQALANHVNAIARSLQSEFGVSQLLDQFPHFLDMFRVGSSEGGSTDLRQLDPATHAARQGLSAAKPSHTLYDFRLNDVRELVIAEMLNDKGGADRFMRMNRILSDMWLEEGTNRARRLDVVRIADLDTLAPVLQAVFHGLLSLDPKKLSPKRHNARSTARHEDAYSALPNDHYRRYAYLYKFLYRRVIEDAPAWMLGRGLLRNDVRVELLAMFLNPEWARHVLQSIYRHASHLRNDRDFLTSKEPGGHGLLATFNGKVPHLADELGSEILSSMLHALGRHDRYKIFSQAAISVADRVGRKSSSGTGRRPHAKVQSTSIRKLDFQMIAIDALQAGAQVDQARERCLSALGTLGVEAEALVPRRSLSDFGWDKDRFERASLTSIADKISRRAASPTEARAISGLLFRLGEMQATSADFNDDRSDLHGSLVNYASAYGTYWIADRTRASSATKGALSTEWPAVSARAMRYYVRVSLKMAKMLVLLRKDAPADESVNHDAADAFYLHACDRIAVYTRHLSRLPAERIHSTLLLASACRVRAGMMRGRSAAPEDLLTLLEASRRHIDDAEGGLAALDYAPALLKRFLLERAKTCSKIARWQELLGKDAQPLAAASLVRHDLSLLCALSSNNVYWRKILIRLSGTLGELTTGLQLPDWFHATQAH